MAKIHIIQAQYGDSFILEFGSDTEKKFILIDGGPAGVYKNHLKDEISNIIKVGGVIDVLIVSHIDTDHIKGILDLLTDIKKQRDQHTSELILIKELWHNSFSHTIDLDGNIEQSAEKICEFMDLQSMSMDHTEMVITSQKEASKVRTFANALEIIINPSSRTQNNFFSLETSISPIKIDDLTLIITGPTKDNLLALRNEWTEWTENRLQEISNGTFDIAAYLDDTAPNLSSIIFLAKLNNKTILFTGDARGDHIIEGLKKRELLKSGKIHVDILKVPHHGSDRNTSREFFEIITADRYIISANGKHNNPDYPTLSWIIEAAVVQKRKVELIITNETNTTNKILIDYPKENYTYNIIYIEKNRNSIALEI